MAAPSATQNPLSRPEIRCAAATYAALAAACGLTAMSIDPNWVPLATVLRGRRAHEREEARLLRAGVWRLGPRPDLVGRRVPVVPASAGGGAHATVDAAGEYAAVDPTAPFVPAFVTGRLDGVAADAELAVAVDGRVAATTRAYPSGRRMLYGAIVPPASFRPGANAVSVLEVLPGSRLRTIGSTGAGGR